MGIAAGPVLSVGKVRLLGLMPNGQTFGAIPKRVWRIDQSSAEMLGEDFGAPGPLPQQDRLGDFMLPQRGLFFAEVATVFTPPDHPIGWPAGARNTAGNTMPEDRDFSGFPTLRTRGTLA
jgi:hypothetical protein